ncbi:MAG: peptidylprolyl isomerase [Allobaculum sp.]|nr:peptidylprolyl isomerase [Allobaculum sp.]
MKTFWNKVALFSLSAALLLAGCSSTSSTTSSQSSSESTSQSSSSVAKQDHSIPGGQQYEAVITIEGYDTPIVFDMDEGIAPETVDNFVSLAQSGFYDGLTLHRIMEGFMIQGGDPRGNGTGGSSHQITGEFASNGFDNSLKHVRGTVSMARSTDPDSASSQFFIVQEDSSSLDGQYAAFGTVVSGMETVDAIAAAAEPTDDNGTIEKEAQPIITSIVVTKKDPTNTSSSATSSEVSQSGETN